MGTATLFCNLKPSLSYYSDSIQAFAQQLGQKAKRLGSGAEQDPLVAIEEINGLLARIDPAPSSLLQAVDAKAQDYGMYFAAAYSDTLDLNLSLSAYKQVKDFVRIILLMDRYFEVGNQRYRRTGQAVIAQLRDSSDSNVQSILRFNMKQFWPFWKFEQYTKKLMMNGYNFSRAEVKRFNLFKSSDAFVLYAPVLEARLAHFNHNAAVIIHYIQALQDIEDDLDDIKEDLYDQMPNIFILASLGNQKPEDYIHLYRHRMNGAKLSILEKSIETVVSIVNEYTQQVDEIALPEQFNFLKSISLGYASKIKAKIAASLPPQELEAL